jgi:hypothetical protein
MTTCNEWVVVEDDAGENLLDESSEIRHQDLPHTLAIKKV